MHHARALFPASAAPGGQALTYRDDQVRRQRKVTDLEIRQRGRLLDWRRTPALQHANPCKLGGQGAEGKPSDGPPAPNLRGWSMPQAKLHLQRNATWASNPHGSLMTLQVAKAAYLKGRTASRVTTHGEIVVACTAPRTS